VLVTWEVRACSGIGCTIRKKATCAELQNGTLPDNVFSGSNMLILFLVAGIEPKMMAVSGISFVTVIKVYFILLTHIAEHVFGCVVYAVKVLTKCPV
jgi:hypothetical protein